MNNSQVKLPPPPPPAQVTNESRRKKEDNLAAVFMGFIIVFLVCHLPRLLLNIHELATIRYGYDKMVNRLREQASGIQRKTGRSL